jgi:hypothetical protein
MSDAAVLDDHLPEVPAEVVDEIAMWRRIVGNADPENDIHDLLRNAAAALFAIRKKAADSIVAQAIVDGLADMAIVAGIDENDAGLIFYEAEAELLRLPSTERANGHALDEPPPALGPDDYGASAEAPPTPPEPLRFIDIAAWHGEPAPEREWAVRDRVPLKNVTLLSGEGSRFLPCTWLWERHSGAIGSGACPCPARRSFCAARTTSTSSAGALIRSCSTTAPATPS